ncbi:MAG TPA: hypothetical protein VN783_10050 [Thermoanaerobaculia bacterium]|nr:hypothetical protein [Thermoanaerobaculia bacterium]
MRRVAVPLVFVMVSILGATAARANIAGGGGAGIQCNYDLTNTGSKDAYDVAVVLKGNVSVSGFYNGIFGSPTVTVVGGNTVLHWANPPGPVGKNDKIHVGYTPVGTSDCPVIDIYWTDASGNRIPTSFVGTAWNHTTGTSVTITNRSFGNILISDVQYACQSAPLPLDALNATNEYLAQAMVPIAGTFTLGAGETQVLPIHPSCSDCYCVTNFKTSGDEPGAIFSPWVQEHVE